MVLREKLKSIRMNKGENMTTYLTRITQVRDELGAIGEVIQSVDLVRTASNGVAKPWVVFVESVVAREHMPSWDRLWDDFIWEETRRGYVQGSTSHNKDDEENVVSSKGEEEEVQEGFQGWNQATGWREERHEQREMICLPEVWTLCWTVPKQEEEETIDNDFSRD